MRHEEFTGQVQSRARLDSRGAAERATRATLETLAERIPAGLAEKLAAQLPHEIAEHLRRIEKAPDVPATGVHMSAHEFFERVAQREEKNFPKAVHHARSVIEVVAEAVQGSVTAKVRDCLDHELATSLFAGSTGSAPSHRPGVRHQPPQRKEESRKTALKLESSAFEDHHRLPPRYTEDAGNVSPPLAWSGVPDEATELVLLCEDVDVPSGSFVHWTVVGINPHSRGMEAGQTPPGGTALVNGFGRRGWSGPNPPPGEQPHRYVFHLYALAEPCVLPDLPSAEEVHEAVERRELADSTLVGLYQH
ncbi:YbhB/YbcL family Raf kinase inhibitor-like protein [Streptomyces gossypiisoli]|uniref:YbhB/YbcL family Raf kinase inhibitor-like protein n=1 Tax=Streptomyces TaxID=1883 RepID=UPI002F96966D